MLQKIAEADNTEYFSGEEKNLLNYTVVDTHDYENDTDYNTCDRFYLPGAYEVGEKSVLIGCKSLRYGWDDNELPMSKYWNEGECFLLRDPIISNQYGVLVAYPGSGTAWDLTWGENALRPLVNIILNNVLFASAAEPSRSDIASVETISHDEGMSLRLEDKTIGSVIYDAEAGIITANKEANGDVALIVQGKTDDVNWYYSKLLAKKTETISVSSIEDKVKTEDIDLSKCKIWLERVENRDDSLCYAVAAVPAGQSEDGMGAEHDHTYKEEPEAADYDKDESNHWLACTGVDCDDREGSIINMEPHSYTDDSDSTCNVCGYDRSHKHDLENNLEFVEPKEPSCTETGNIGYYKCKECGTIYTTDELGTLVCTSRSQITLSAIPHSYSTDYKYADAMHWSLCTECGMINMEPHSLHKGTCTVCGYHEKTTSSKSSGSGSGTTAVATINTLSDDSSWSQDDKGWRYTDMDGGYAGVGWKKLSWQGRYYWYYFNADSYMTTGWLDLNGERYYLNPVVGTNSGKMATGWQLIDGSWYYFSVVSDSNEGKLLRSTVTPDGYSVDENGRWIG